MKLSFGITRTLEHSDSRVILRGFGNETGEQ